MIPKHIYNQMYCDYTNNNILYSISEIENEDEDETLFFLSKLRLDSNDLILEKSEKNDNKPISEKHSKQAQDSSTKCLSQDKNPIKSETDFSYITKQKSQNDWLLFATKFYSQTIPL